MSKEVYTGSGLGLGTVMFLIFLTLKLVGAITWSWWLVTLPLWWSIPFLLGLGIVALIVIIIRELVK